VQVDEDMLLHPHAVRTLHEAMAAAAPDVAVLMRNLYDVHLERCVFGVKIFRHEIVRRYPFRAMEAFEVDQVERFEADGYTMMRCPAACDRLPVIRSGCTEPDGHRSDLRRYANLQRRRRGYPDRMQWFADYGPDLPAALSRRSERPQRARAARTDGWPGRRAHGRAKDYRTRDSVLGIAHVRAWLDALRRHAAGRQRSGEDDAPAVHRSLAAAARRWSLA
jgi:hypothetical protein